MIFLIPFILFQNPNQDIIDLRHKTISYVYTIRAGNYISSGVIIYSNGFIVTVIPTPDFSRDEIYATSPEDTLNAEYIGWDELTHITLFITHKQSQTPSFASVESLQKGTPVIVVGNAEGIPNSTVFTHIEKIEKERLFLYGWVFPGQSGAPVFSANGKLVGIVRGITPSDELRLSNIGTSVLPIDIVLSRTKHIKEKGEIRAGWLGVLISENKGRIVINDILKGSPASNAGLKVGDIIVRYNGKEVWNITSLSKWVKETKPKSNVIIEILRDNNRKVLNCKIGYLSEMLKFYKPRFIGK